jgi:cell division protein FtsI/penicillin-binding protein 2
MNNSRALIVFGAIIIFAIVILIRLINIQVINKEKYAQLAEQQQTSLEKIKAEFGLILDRNNNLLVYNRSDVSFYLDLNVTNNKEKDSIAQKFSEVFEKSERYYLSLMNKSKGTILLQPKVQPSQLEKLKGFEFRGLYYVPDPSRIYHHGSLASHILGFVNKQNIFVSGISEFFSKDLQGIEGYRKVYKNSLGKVVSYDEREMQPPVPVITCFLLSIKDTRLFLKKNYGKEWSHLKQILLLV